MVRLIRFWLLAALYTAALAAATNLEIYTIDVEGGKSVLTVSPSGESMLVDVGWPMSGNREASTDRIVEAAQAAGLKQIDYLVISHFDVDHIGDVAALVAKFPVKHILDHGEFKAYTPPPPPPGAEPPAGGRAGRGGRGGGGRQLFDAYAAVREKLPHTVLKVGDKVPIKGIDVEVVSAGGELLQKPLKGAGARNPLCSQYEQKPVVERDVEDNQSIGMVYTFGSFRMLDLADLEAHLSHNLACPANLIGTVDIYHVNVHGQFKGIAPELVHALHAKVIIQGNGSRKGADADTWPVLKSAPGLEDIWQVHWSANAGEGKNPPEDFLANLETPTDEHKWVKVSVQPNGTFTVSNSRNGFSKTYKK